MKEGRASFLDLLARIDSHLRTTDLEARLPELDGFWRAARNPPDAVASEAFDRLLRLAQGHGFDTELLPFVEASRVWARKVGRASLYDQNARGCAHTWSAKR